MQQEITYLIMAGVLIVAMFFSLRASTIANSAIFTLDEKVANKTLRSYYIAMFLFGFVTVYAVVLLFSL